MGSGGKTAFIAILVLGAITGIVMYYLFENFSMPKPGIVNSGLRSNLTEVPSEEGSGNIMDEDDATTATGAATTNATTTAADSGGAATTPAATAAAAAATLTIPTGAATPGNPAYE